MGLGVVARYSTLVEAEVACSALRAAGFHADVLERGLASALWSHQTALGGLRVAVPIADLQDAVECLTEIGRAQPGPYPRRRDDRLGWRLLACAVGLGFLPQAGWVVVGARDRLRKCSALGLWGIVVATVMLCLLLALAAGALAILAAFIDGWLIHPRITSS